MACGEEGRCQIRKRGASSGRRGRTSSASNSSAWRSFMLLNPSSLSAILGVSLLRRIGGAGEGSEAKN